MFDDQIAACLIGLALGLGSTSQQTPNAPLERGNAMPSEAPCYRLRRVLHSSPGNPRQVLIVISLGPKHFVREDMLALAYDLKQLYASEPRFGAIILDDDEAALHTSPIHRKEEYMRSRRGFYYSNRVTGEERIQFSTERGKPWDEVKITLGAL